MQLSRYFFIFRVPLWTVTPRSKTLGLKDVFEVLGFLLNVFAIIWRKKHPILSASFTPRFYQSPVCHSVCKLPFLDHLLESQLSISASQRLCKDPHKGCEVGNLRLIVCSVQLFQEEQESQLRQVLSNQNFPVKV